MATTNIFNFICLTLLFSCSATFASKEPKSTEQPTEFSAASLLSGKSQSDLIVFATFQFVIDGSDNKSQLYSMDLSSQKQSPIALPSNISGRTLLAIFPQKNTQAFYVLSQLQKAGTDKPQVDRYDLKTKKWSSVQNQINCVNIENFEINAKQELVLKCGEDYIHPPTQAELKIKLKGVETSILKNKAWNITKSESQQDVEITQKNKTISLKKTLGLR